LKNNLYIILLIFSTLCFSQERVNDPKIQFDEIGKNFDNVSGWTFFNGEWTEEKNEIRISFDFKSFRFRSLTYKSFKYYIFTVLTRQGFWEYPEIQAGFFERDIYAHFIFTHQQFQDLKKFKKVKSNFDYFETTDEINDANEVVDLLNGKHSMKWSYDEYNKTLDFRLEKIKQKNVRFLIPFDDTYSHWKFNDAYFEFSLEDFKTLTSLK